MYISSKACFAYIAPEERLENQDKKNFEFFRSTLRNKSENPESFKK